jgi:hypothetical protein
MGNLLKGAALGLAGLALFEALFRSSWAAVLLAAPSSALGGAALAFALGRVGRGRAPAGALLGVLATAASFVVAFTLNVLVGNPLRLHGPAREAPLAGLMAFAWLSWFTVPLGLAGGALLGLWMRPRA